MENKKINVQDQWSEKFLRESPWMPFGSMCNFLGQAFQGKEIDTAKLEELATKAFELSMTFTELAYNRTQKVDEKGGSSIKIPIKVKNEEK